MPQNDLYDAGCLNVIFYSESGLPVCLLDSLRYFW